MTLRGPGHAVEVCALQPDGNPAPLTDRHDATSRELTGYCPDAENTALASPDALAHLASEYECRARLRPHVADRRVAACGCIVYGDPSIVTIEYADGTRKARWSGVILCNRAGCPVCGAIRARRFGERVRRTLGSGGLWQHVILTVPHRAGEAWSVVYDRLLHGIRDLTHGQAGRVLRGLQEASIRATESTWSVRSGWHVHFHCLWRLRRPMMAAEFDVLEQQWCERTAAEKGYGMRLGASFDCNHADQRNWAAKYVSKLSLELSGSGKHAHPEHFTMGEVFTRASRASDDRDRMFLGLVREYQEATKGRRIYQLDRRAKRMHDAAPELPERVVVREWRTEVYREEFSGLSRAERHRRVWDAVYLPLEVAATARGDPASAISAAIDSLLQAYDSTRKPS